MSKQIEITKPEATALTVILTGTLSRQERDYKENKKDNSFDKEGALEEINLLKGLLKKIEKI
jgi:hypothetical protein